MADEAKNLNIASYEKTDITKKLKKLHCFS